MVPQSGTVFRVNAAKWQCFQCNEMNSVPQSGTVFSVL